MSIRSAKAKLYITVGALMLILGPVLTLLGVIGLLPPSFLLYFLAYIISLIGLLIGSLGINLMFLTKRKKKD